MTDNNGIGGGLNISGGKLVAVGPKEAAGAPLVAPVDQESVWAVDTTGRNLYYHDGTEWKPAFPPTYVTGQLSLNLGSWTNTNHNLGAAPTKTSVDLVCKVANNGYSVGDIVFDIKRGFQSFVPEGSTTDVNLIISPEIYVKRRDFTNADFLVDATQWDYIFRASL